MHGEQWSIDKHLMAIRAMERHEDITSLDFDETSFWVQIHGLPVGSMSHKIALEVCSMMGKAIENVDDEGKQGWCNFQRVRVALPSFCAGDKNYP